MKGLDVELTYRMSIRLFADGVKCFGPGLFELLSRVGESHSLSQSARDMNMAYSKAWRIVNDAESALKLKLLDTSVGGKQGGGALLTDDAKKLISDYSAFVADVRAAADRHFAENFDV